MKLKEGNELYKAYLGLYGFGRGWNIRKGNKWGSVNDRGEWLFPIEYEDILPLAEGGHLVKQKGKWGFCNSDGVFTLDFKYDELKRIGSNWDIQILYDKKIGVWFYRGFKESDGWPDFVSFDLCKWKGFMARIGDKWGYVDENGHILVDIDKDEIHYDPDRVIRYKKFGADGSFRLYK